MTTFSLFRRALLLPALLSGGMLSAQVIGTYAGTDYTFPSDAVAAREAFLAEPWAFAKDRNGAIYFSQSNQILRLSANLGEVSVFAGNGISGYSGDGGDARSASLNGPAGLAFDASGNLFFSDRGNHRVRRIATNGTITTVAGTGKPGVGAENAPALETPLNEPVGVAFDLEGRLCIVDHQNHRVRRIDAAGRISTIAGVGARGYGGDRGPATQARLAFPLAIHPDEQGNLFVADDNNKLIRRISPDGIIITVAGTTADGYAGDGASALTAAFRGPRDGRPDGTGGILIADHFNRRVRRVNPAGRIDTVAGNGVSGFSGDGESALQAQLAGPNATLPEPGGAFLIADAVNRRIRRVSGGIINTVAGAGIRAGDPNASRESQVLGTVTGMRMDANRNIYFTDRSTHRLLRLSPAGALTVIAGNGIAGFSGDNGQATRAQLNAAWGVAIDRSGNIYMAEYEGDRIRKVSPNGVITTVAGNGVQGWSGDGPALSNQVNHPKGLDVDAAGNVYIADFGNNRIRRLTTSGQLETIAGAGVQCPNNPSLCFNGDNRPATQTNIYWPTGITVTPNGTIYISDTLNHVVRRFTVGGTMTIVAGTGGQFGYSGDGGPATQAKLNQPTDIALDSLGNLYIADTGNNTIRVVSPSGTIRSFAGSGPGGFQGDGGLASEAWLNGPSGLLITAEDDVYIADTGNLRIRLVPAQAPAVPAPTPSAISLEGISLGGRTDQKSVALSSSAAGLRYSVIVPESAPWLKVSQAAGSLPAGLQLWADTGALDPGDYSANVVIATPTGRPVAQSVQVRLHVSEPVTPELKPGSTSLLFRGLRGGRLQETALPVGIAGSGAVSLSYSLESAAGENWLSLSATEDTASAENPALLRLQADPANLQAGTYTVKLLVRGVSQQLGTELETRIPVTLVVQEPRPQLTLSRDALTFEIARGSTATQPQPLHVLNTGQGGMNFRVSAATLSGGNWLTIDTTEGSVQRPGLDIGTVRVGLTAQVLPAGVYFGTVTVDAGSAGSRVAVVQLTVAADGASLSPEMQPSALVFSGLVTDRPGSQTVTIVNRRAGPVSYTTIPTTGGRPWLRYSPSSATIPAGGRVRVAIQAEFEQLPAGLSTGSLLFRFDDGTSQSVDILAAVDGGDAADPSGAKTSERSAGCTPQTITLRLLNGQSPMRVRWGQPFNLDFSMTDNCGRQIPSGGTGANLVAGAFSTGESGGAFQPAAGGAWTRTFTLSSTESRSRQSSTLKIAGVAGSGGTGVAAGFTDVAFTVTEAAGATPRVDKSVNGASYEVDVPVAPGSVVTFFGEALGPDAGATPAGGATASEIDGTEVLLGDRKLPLLYASNGQINAQIPYGIEDNSIVQVRVKRRDTLSAPTTLAVAAARPAIFTADRSGQGVADAINQDGSRHGAENVAPEGSIISIYCTGLGRVSPEIPDGVPAPAEPLSPTVAPVLAFVNGQPAEVLYSGAAPGLMGAYQVNLRIPAGVSAERPEASLILQTTGQESLPVTIYVGAPAQ